MTPELAQVWLERWDAQQERYVADREARFAAIGEVVAQAVPGSPLVLDLGCGPGSLSVRLARRLPSAEVVGVDVDPLLLALGTAGYPEISRLVDADLRAPGWPAALGLDRKVDAVVSTTALHYLPKEQLGALYAELAGLLRPGGVLVNADNVLEEQPTVATLAAALRRTRTAEGEDWSGWWRAIEAEPALADLVAERRRRLGSHGGDHHLPLRTHRELLWNAGFSEAGTVWQTGDDVILVAVR
ncbi:class I SAM-dependent methyltransferase [Nonomuraea africana]|uniref:Trans-aconitate methyltransferase n=1 Tax=Nonomuraea africana TaxID=46171 RepID=A0ABR9K9P1_9ACTN|nr:class I SAM-dependent methyltransferase [Nonomuraea africana]MBE1558721.1 trans-aconitate methyltransferase [Nonomuraea africana]